MPTLALKWYPQDLIGQAHFLTSLQPIRIRAANAFSARAFSVWPAKRRVLKKAVCHCTARIDNNNVSFQQQNSMIDVSVALRPLYLCPLSGAPMWRLRTERFHRGETLIRITLGWKSVETLFLVRWSIYQLFILSQSLD